MSDENVSQKTENSDTSENHVASSDKKPDIRKANKDEKYVNDIKKPAREFWIIDSDGQTCDYNQRGFSPNEESIHVIEAHALTELQEKYEALEKELANRKDSFSMDRHIELIKEVERLTIRDKDNIEAQKIQAAEIRRLTKERDEWKWKYETVMMTPTDLQHANDQLREQLEQEKAKRNFLFEQNGKLRAELEQAKRNVKPIENMHASALKEVDRLAKEVERLRKELNPKIKLGEKNLLGPEYDE